MNNVLITGGTGLIGSRLTELLKEKGYNVSYLSRHKGNGSIKTYLWEPSEGKIDEESLNEADYIINLAGAGVLEEKWTKDYKKKIISSRVDAITIIYDRLKLSGKKPKAFISSSATGFYGSDTGDKLLTEDSAAGDDFLAEVVKHWEAAADKITSLNIRTVKIRTGIALSSKGGALEKLAAPIKKGAGVVVGSGKQFVSWIHMDDLCNIYIKALEDERMNGVYNAVAPNPVTNEELTKTAGEILGKPIVLPHVPAFALKLMLGSERAEVVLGGNKISPAKVLETGFQFSYSTIKPALENLLK